MILSLEAIEKKNFEGKLKMWAKEVVEYYHSMAIEGKIDRTFYAFQSEPKEKPECLILGFNPYGECSYADQYKNEKWEIPNGMTPEVFIHQNPWYYGGKHYDEKEKWNILNKFDVMLATNTNLKELMSDMVYMNILYFNSKDFSEFKSKFPKYWKEAYTKSIDYTKFLIQNIIKPKIVICLGIDNCFKKFIPANSEVKNILPKYPNAAHKTIINGIPVYGIIHPSYRMTNELREEIGEAIEKDLK